MTREYLAADDITTPEAFEAALTELAIAAHEAGVEVEGAWECRSDNPGGSWEANIVELASSDDD
jgi:hypothetical protein